MEEEPVRDAVVREMKGMEQLVATLMAELGTALVKQSAQHVARVDELAGRIASAQRAIVEYVPRLVEQQALHAQILKLEKYNQQLDDLVQVSALKVYETEAALMDEIELARSLMPAADASGADTAHDIEPDELVQYAARVRGCLGAPPNWDVSRPLPHGFFPPAPSEEMMRSSKLGELSAPETFKNVLLSHTLHLSKKQLNDADSDASSLSEGGDGDDGGGGGGGGGGTVNDSSSEEFEEVMME
ncbi:putative mediator of RNA polymerase II transcription subunit 4 [Porphyridium purpureum]|uniref:Mediator of RNA polymerase II transcription subunit 4 n=1 Tax=Porphyridium purpureum TaxID=35688 RepID=A0A5J4YNZ6_PORPP|nr:putative mediator of RNA polymerase II transcription subunit 4 [Porphyridium purpureum]|eukprot:POR0881..scf222_8